MKTFETPVIEVITFTAENIMSASSSEPTVDNDRTPWG